ncbi:hypothetical protein Taro_009147 [Colocasia esculenta]|uniref:Uncharacterized protein n=1 Tax=Colocasia esculenta TaxID=4460 RepID=A0A843U461_COLES|nr:hypothetical protein [Colocasia esculenta]
MAAAWDNNSDSDSESSLSNEEEEEANLAFMANVKDKVGFRSGFWRRERGPRKDEFVLVRADWRLLDKGGVSSFVIRSSSKRRSHDWRRIRAVEVEGKGLPHRQELDVQITCRLYLVNGGIVYRLSLTMATRGCSGAVLTWGDESAGGSQAPAQQAQDQTGVPLPPPLPPVDYGALMQGLVHAMQTQAQTIAALQAQAPAHEAVFGGVPMMERFRRMTPPFFKGESDPILAESWLRESEKIFRTLRFTEEERVTLARYMLQERVDVWWSSVLRT